MATSTVGVASTAASVGPDVSRSSLSRGWTAVEVRAAETRGPHVVRCRSRRCCHVATSVSINSARCSLMATWSTRVFANGICTLCAWTATATDPLLVLSREAKAGLQRRGQSRRSRSRPAVAAAKSQSKKKGRGGVGVGITSDTQPAPAAGPDGGDHRGVRRADGKEMESQRSGEGLPRGGGGGRRRVGSGNAEELEEEGGVALDDMKLPRVSRARILGACSLTSGAMAVAGLVGREAFHWAATAGALQTSTSTLPSPIPLPTSFLHVHDCVKLIPLNFSLSHTAEAVGLAIAVSLARELVSSFWPELREGSERSNAQVLSPLVSPWDLVLVSFLPGYGEEVFFRGLLLPAVQADWSGVLLSGAVFGALHVTGGRNLASGIWATCVGIAYGAAGVSGSDLSIPIIAHSVANLIACTMWKYKNEKSIQKNS